MKLWRHLVIIAAGALIVWQSASISRLQAEAREAHQNEAQAVRLVRQSLVEHIDDQRLIREANEVLKIAEDRIAELERQVRAKGGAR